MRWCWCMMVQTDVTWETITDDDSGNTSGIRLTHAEYSLKLKTPTATRLRHFTTLLSPPFRSHIQASPTVHKLHRTRVTEEDILYLYHICDDVSWYHCIESIYLLSWICSVCILKTKRSAEEFMTLKHFLVCFYKISSLKSTWRDVSLCIRQHKSHWRASNVN